MESDPAERIGTHPFQDANQVSAGWLYLCSLRLYVFACIGRLMGLILCECTLYLSFLTWLAMLPRLICFLILALDIGNPLDGMGSIFAIPWLHSLLGAFAWLVLPGLYLCLPCLALPPCWSSFLYLIFLFLSDGLILLPSPKCGLVCLFCVVFFRARRKGLTSPHLHPSRNSVVFYRTQGPLWMFWFFCSHVL